MIEKQNAEARREKQRRKAQAEVVRRSQVGASPCYQRRLGLCEEPCNALCQSQMMHAKRLCRIALLAHCKY